MAGFCWRPAAQIEKFSVAKWNVWLCLRSRKIGDCSILIPNSISDKVGFWPIHCTMLVDISAARTHDEWVNIDEHKRCTRAIFSCYCWRVGGEKRREEAPYGSPGTEEPLSIFRIFPVKFRKRYQSHFETPGLHLFVRDAERCSDDCANSSNPTYSRSSHKTHTHTHHALHSICHFQQPLCPRHLLRWSLLRGTRRSWLRKQSQLCRQPRVKNKKYTMAVWAEATRVYIG